MTTQLPLRWLEQDYIDEDEPGGMSVRCHPLTIADALDSDVAQVFSDESASGPKLTHDEAVAYVRLFVAAPLMRAALTLIVNAHANGDIREPYNDYGESALKAARDVLAAIEEAEGRT